MVSQTVKNKKSVNEECKWGLCKWKKKVVSSYLSFHPHFTIEPPMNQKFFYTWIFVWEKKK